MTGPNSVSNPDPGRIAQGAVLPAAALTVVAALIFLWNASLNRGAEKTFVKYSWRDVPVLPRGLMSEVTPKYCGIDALVPLCEINTNLNQSNETANRSTEALVKAAAGLSEVQVVNMSIGDTEAVHQHYAIAACRVGINTAINGKRLQKWIHP